MNKIHMPHSAGSPRYKPLEKIQSMIVQYENQVAGCEDALALSLMTKKLSELKQLVKNNSKN